MLCPECLGPMVTRDGKTATCTLHGGEYRILFLRALRVAPPALSPFAVAAPLVAAAEAEVWDAGVDQADNPYRNPTPVIHMCARHANVEARHSCAVCGLPMCAVCAFPQADGTQLCSNCVGQGRMHLALAGEDFSGVMCGRHPEVQAVQRCTSCRQPVCGTCDFAMPGGVHVCPDCATKSDRRLSSARRRQVGWAYAAAVWCTLGLVVIFSGALAEAMTDKAAEEAIGVAMWIFVFLPALIGTALALSSLDRRLRNPPVIWGAVVWNLLVVAILILLTIVGIVMQ